MIIRTAKPEDAAPIRDIVRAAFAGDQEANLVVDLDRAGEL